MPCVVADTSPLFYLAQLERLNLLRELYGEIFAPESVWAETLAGCKIIPSAQTHLKKAFDAGWLIVCKAPAAEKTDAAALLEGLDRGERDALLLAQALHASLVLIDEKRGRAAAEKLGLSITGTLGVLAEAKRKGHLPALAPELERLRRQTTFRLSRELEILALKLVAESPLTDPNP